MSMNELLEKISRLEQGPADQPVVPAPELVGFCVRLARGLRQWKRSTLANFATASVSTVERVERGEKVSDEALDRIAEALGYDRGYFTAPRLRISAEQAAEKLAEKYGELEPVSVRPLRTQRQVRELAMCDGCLVHRPDIGRAYDDQVSNLSEWLDLASFILSNPDPREKDRRRELYGSILTCVQGLEARGVSVLAGTMGAPQDGLMDWKVAILSITPKLSDPGATKRRFVFVDRRCVALRAPSTSEKVS
ncbi:MAG TPA: helix-turn-helix transcriptional regulator [Planctomycetota bacterium]|nr:helix-turn-helix transcriptional regulator [Planctomycetota bacterium]